MHFFIIIFLTEKRCIVFIYICFVPLIQQVPECVQKVCWSPEQQGRPRCISLPQGTTFHPSLQRGNCHFCNSFIIISSSSSISRLTGLDGHDGHLQQSVFFTQVHLQLFGPEIAVWVQSVIWSCRGCACVLEGYSVFLFRPGKFGEMVFLSKALESFGAAW